MDSERPDEVLGTSIPTVHEIDLSNVLSDLNAKLRKEKDTTTLAQTRATEHFACLTQKPDSKEDQRSIFFPKKGSWSSC